MKKEYELADIMIDCDDERKLQKFYADLLGWEMCEMYDSPAVKSSTGIVFLFYTVPGYERPVWPEKPGKPQQQLHLDFHVEDIYEAAERAEKLGAVRTKEQYGGDVWITMLDPAGHPFCLCREE